MSLLGTQEIDAVTADLLLAIPEGEPEKLFSAANTAQVKKEYHELAKRWHTDRNSDPLAKDVMQRVQLLYQKANEKIEHKTWEIPNLLRFETMDKQRYQIQYLKKQPFELGDMYIADASVTYVVNKSDQKLFDNAKNTITGLRYPDDRMKQMLKPILPEIKRTFETNDKLIMMLNKDPEAILLSDVIGHMKGKIEPTHAAWMMSRLHNLTCYLDWAGLTHNALTTENCFIWPKDHRISLLGGWWYAAKQGEKLKAIPPKTATIAPASLFDKPIADPRLDLSLIRATGREILGDSTGMNLIRDKDIPKPMTSWVNGASSGDPRQDYKIWSEEILTKSFGARRFVEMKLSSNDVYKP